MRTTVKSRRWVCICALALATSAGAGVARVRADDAPKKPDERWVGTWSAAPQLTEPGNMPPAPGLTDTTLRQIVYVSIGGKSLRLRFSNAFGSKPLTIRSVHIAKSARGGNIDADTDKPVTFHGQGSATIATGAPLVSDPIAFELAPLSDLAVTIYVQDATKSITGHPGSRCTSYLESGDKVTDSRLSSAAKTTHWYYLCGVDVLTDREGCAVAVLGDSITDGRGSTTDGNNRWPDQLARRILEDRSNPPIGVLNQGIGGNRVLNDGLGPSALARLDRDVLAQAGVRWLIVFEGINDLGTRSATSDELIAAYEQIIERAHARDIKVYGATIPPCGGSFYYNAKLEIAREAINTWIRTSNRFDAVIDFDEAIRDPQKPTHLSAKADGGDHLHPGVEGYKTMADVIDLKLFARSSR